MKKVLVLLFCLVCSVVMFGCGETASESYEIALITDSGTITDMSFNQSSYEAISEWADENEKTYKYYVPLSTSETDIKSAVETAISNDAKVVVTPGYAFSTIIYELQQTYTDVKFIAVDYVPSNGEVDDDYQELVSNNTYSISFSDEQSGYLAGYASVMDGETNIGFIGGEIVPSVVRYGVGYINGANDASLKTENNVNVWYGYSESFVPKDSIATTTEQWIDDGVETIFSCGGGIWQSVADGIIAKDNNTKLIGVDINQQPVINAIDDYSDITVLTSATKEIATAIKSALDYYGIENWDAIGGKADTLGISQDYTQTYVGLPTEEKSWNFSTFTVEDYNAVITSIQDGTIQIINDTATDIETYIDSCTNLTLKTFNSSI